MAGSKLTFTGARMSSNDCLNQIAFGGGATAGGSTAVNQATQITAEQATAAVLGTTAGSGVVTDTTGTIQQYVRGLVALLVAKITVKIDQTTPGSTNGVQPKKYTGVPSSMAIRTADEDVFTLAANEVGFIQVLSADAPLAVKLGTGASPSSLNFVLAAGTAASDGKGGAYKIDYWTGVVSVAKMTGTSSYLAWKIAP